MDAVMMHLTLHNNDPSETHSILQVSFSSLLMVDDEEHHRHNNARSTSPGAKSAAAAAKRRSAMLPGEKRETGKAVAMQEATVTKDKQLQEVLKKLSILLF